MTAAESDHIVATTEGRVRTVVINRPEKKNAITLSMYGRLVDELEQAAEDPAIRVVVITGVDGVFTAGNDLADLQKPSQDERTPGVFPFLAALVTALTIVMVTHEPSYTHFANRILEIDDGAIKLAQAVH